MNCSVDSRGHSISRIYKANLVGGILVRLSSVKGKVIIGILGLRFNRLKLIIKIEQIRHKPI